MSLALLNNLPASEPELTETELDAAIASDWKRHQELVGQRRAAYRATAGEWCQIRARLGARLAQMQSLLAASGRDGQFAEYLRDWELSKATAYRLIKKHKKMTNGLSA